MLDSPERTVLYEEMAHIVVEDCPWIFMYQPMDFGLTHSWVENYLSHDFPYGMGKYRRVNEDVQRQWFESYGDKKLGMSGQE